MRRTTRKLKRGGARGETMRFIYTTNPLRRGWTETIYPLAQFFLQIPSQIPWGDYEYVGPTSVDVEVFDENNNSSSIPTTLRNNLSENENNNHAPGFNAMAMPPLGVPVPVPGASRPEVSGLGTSASIPDLNNNALRLQALANRSALEANMAAYGSRPVGSAPISGAPLVVGNARFITVNPAHVVAPAVNPLAAYYNYKELSVRARCHRVPYELFGGSVCELYDRFIEGNRLGIKLHDSTDPTGDMDILMKDLDVELTHPDEIEPADRDSIKSVAIVNRVTNAITPLFDHYTRWIIHHIVRLLKPIVKKTSGPHFFPKQQARNAELVDADILERVGNFLVTRAITRGMLKIQCGIGVNTPDGPIEDHVFELIFSIHELKIDDTTNHTYPPEMASTYSLPVSFGPNRFNLFVQDPVTLVNGQAKGFIDRLALRSMPDYKHKLYNHYGRLVFGLQLLLEAHMRGIPPVFYKRSYFPYLNRILDDDLFDLIPSPCYEPCKKNMIKGFYSLVLGL